MDKVTGRAERQRLEDLQARVATLPIHTARQAVAGLLADPTLYRCSREAPTPQERDVIAVLGPTLREFFTEYAAVTEVYGDMSFERADIRKSERAPTQFRIGQDAEFGEFTAAPESDVVWLHWGEGPPEPPAQYPSVYHILLDGAAVQGRYEPPHLDESPPAS